MLQRSRENPGLVPTFRLYIGTLPFIFPLHTQVYHDCLKRAQRGYIGLQERRDLHFFYGLFFYQFQDLTSCSLGESTTEAPGSIRYLEGGPSAQHVQNRLLSNLNAIQEAQQRARQNRTLTLSTGIINLFVCTPSFSCLPQDSTDGAHHLWLPLSLCLTSLRFDRCISSNAKESFRLGCVLGYMYSPHQSGRSEGLLTILNFKVGIIRRQACRCLIITAFNQGRFNDGLDYL